jgi:Tfp pilus assembly protein PilO
MLLRGMARMDMARRLNAYRVLSLVLCSLALVGWGVFADLRAELGQLKASQDQPLAERTQQQEAVGDLIQLQVKLVSVREELAALAHTSEA